MNKCAGCGDETTVGRYVRHNKLRYCFECCHLLGDRRGWRRLGRNYRKALQRTGLPTPPVRTTPEALLMYDLVRAVKAGAGIEVGAKVSVVESIHPDGTPAVHHVGRVVERMPAALTWVYRVADWQGKAPHNTEVGQIWFGEHSVYPYRKGSNNNGANERGRGTSGEDARDCGRGDTYIEREADRGQVQAERADHKLPCNYVGPSNEGHGQVGQGTRRAEGDSPAVQDRDFDVDRVGIRNGVDDGTGSDNEDDGVAVAWPSDRDDEIVVCGECEQEYTRADSPRVSAGMKCGNCAYG